MSSKFSVKLPASSANLGPRFDAIGLAMAFYLTVEASEIVTPESEHTAFRLTAEGRDAAACSVLENNLILETYLDVLKQRGKAAPSLEIHLQNEIPLGMGCGSSAAALLAGIALANHFGALGMDGVDIV